MAQILCIGSGCEGTGAYEAGAVSDGDIIGIFDDNHVFSDTEKQQFVIVKVNLSKEILDAHIDAIKSDGPKKGRKYELKVKSTALQDKKAELVDIETLKAK